MCQQLESVGRSVWGAQEHHLEMELSGESSHFFFIKLFWVGFTKVMDQDLYIEELLRRVPGCHKVILR